jgi:exopolyphosphatase/pppGpp-phosphohydrolase
MRLFQTNCLLVLVFFLTPTQNWAADTKRFAGIEVGGSGTKLTILEVAENGSFRRLFAESKSTDLTKLTTDRNFAKKEVALTVKYIKSYRETALTMYKVPDDNIILVGSSGIPTNAKNRNELIDAIKTATGKTIRFIDDKTEVALTIVGVVPKQARNRAISLDIGSGNTKGGYKPENGGPLVYVSVPLGAKTFTQKVEQTAKKKNISLVKAAAELRESELVAPMRLGAKKMPELEKRKFVYLSGGMVWALVTYVKPEAVDRSLVSFTPADVEKFAELVQKADGKSPVVNLDHIKDKSVRERAAKELKTVAKVYPPAALLAGSELLRSLVTVFDLKNKTVVFPRNSAYGWLSAYVAGETLEEKRSEKKP